MVAAKEREEMVFERERVFGHSVSSVVAAILYSSGLPAHAHTCIRPFLSLSIEFVTHH